MTDLENNAAQAEDDVVDIESENLDNNTETEAQNAESAPADAETPEQVQVAVQKRINKEVSRRHKETRRADELQRKLDEVNSKPAEIEAKNAPKLEDFDYDQEKFNEALIDHKVEVALSENQQRQAKAGADTRAKEATQTYESLVTEMGKDDFYEVANNIPVLDSELVTELMSSKEGVEMIYHLGSHLDVADRIAGMSPMQAMSELGRISATMSAPVSIKPSAAPDPIEPLNSGGSISQQRGPKGVTYE